MAQQANGSEDLVQVLGDVGLVAVAEADVGDQGGGAVRIGGHRVQVEVRRDVREAGASDLVDRLPAHSLVIADRLSPGARALFEQHDINWLDRRGHLRLVVPPSVFIDRDVEPLAVGVPSRVVDPFTTAGLDVAMALLLQPTEALGVRPVARQTGVSPGRVSELLKEMRGQGLVNRDGRPAVPDLFEAVADAWAVRPVPLGQAPLPDPTLRWGGVHAAIRYGVPLVVTPDWPPRIYVRDDFALRRLVRTYPANAGHDVAPPASVAVCPSPYGFDQVADDDLQPPVVNHVIAAIDLFEDRGRGREALEQWTPEGVVRVW